MNKNKDEKFDKFYSEYYKKAPLDSSVNAKVAFISGYEMALRDCKKIICSDENKDRTDMMYAIDELND